MSTLFGIVIFICTIEISLEELPTTSCPSSRPFQTLGIRCANFQEVCVKTNDIECKKFQNICAQCPPSNFSTLTYLNIENMKEQLKNNVKRTSSIFILLWIIIAFNILMAILLILEIRFGIITKLFHRRKLSDEKHYAPIENEKQYAPIESEQRGDSNDSNIIILNKIDILTTNVNKLIKSIKEKTKICMNGQIIEMKISPRDNCVAVKRKICHKLSLLKSEDCKVLKLKYKGKTLEDNQYFSTFNIPTDEKILCEKDLSINSSNILVVKPAGNIQLPDLIQIQKHQTISDLKKLTPGISDAENLRIFAEIKDGNDKKQFKILKEESTVAQCNIIDEEFLYFISREVKKLAISSIFDEGNSAVIDYDNTDTILAMKKSLCTPLNCCLEDFVLIQKGTLSEKAFAFEYDFTGNDPVKYCRISKLDAIEIGDCVNDGNHSDLFRAKERVTNKKLLIKKYFHTTQKKFSDNIYIIREIITFQLTKDHPRFVNLYGVYNDPKCFYVAMENMELGTLKSFIKVNKPTENDIKKWSSQMLEGLKYLHDHQVIHRDLNPSSILLNESKDLKLSNFNLSKYKTLNEPSSVFVKDVEDLHKLPIKYFAPEILRNERFTTKADVWSFGAILIKIITQRAPFPGKPKLEIKTGFANNEIGDYDCSALQCGEGLRRVIMSCLKIDQGTRSTVESLLNEDFINQ